MKSGLNVENLYFNDILTDINVELKPGTINALVGKSGSGKTTLLKSIAGFADYSGAISLGGIVFDNINIEDQIKNIGIYLNTKILENKSVISNLMNPLLNLNYQEENAKKIVYELTKKLGIDDLLYREVNSLSHSQKKVVAFVQSIVHSPKLLLVDNLFDSLDEYYKEKIISCLKGLKKSKKSIILFTTNNGEDLMLADNLLVIKGGKIVGQGDVEELLKNENLFVKNDIELPFLSDLSNKIMAYEVIDRPIYDMNEMVDEIWH